MRYETGDKVIIRVRAQDTEEGIDQFYAGYVVPPKHSGYLEDPTDYYIQIEPPAGQNIFSRAVSFYDIMPYHKHHLEDLRWESLTAERALRHIREMWGSWYKANG